MLDNGGLAADEDDGDGDYRRVSRLENGVVVPLPRVRLIHEIHRKLIHHAVLEPVLRVDEHSQSLLTRLGRMIPRVGWGGRMVMGWRLRRRHRPVKGTLADVGRGWRSCPSLAPPYQMLCIAVNAPVSWLSPNWWVPGEPTVDWEGVSGTGGHR